MMRRSFRNRLGLRVVLVVAMLSACSDGGGGGAPAAPTSLTVSGSVLDGPVTGGTLFVFTASDVSSAIADAEEAEDRAAALAAANPIATLARDAADMEAYALEIPADLAGQPLFFVFDAAGAEDLTFNDEPFNLEAVAIAGEPGSEQIVNLTPHTTLLTIRVRNALDPEGDGTVIDTAAVLTAIGQGLLDVQDALGTDDADEDLFPGGEDPTETEDDELLEHASTFLGRLVRTSATVLGITPDEVVDALAADAADGVIDGAAPAEFDLTPEEIAKIEAINDIYALGQSREGDLDLASCAASSSAMRRACGFDVLDNFFEGLATCADTSDQAMFDDCAADAELERSGSIEECEDVFDARIALCDALDDAIHEPAFGEDLAENFVDPLEIGATVTPNTYLPLVPGNYWVYESTFLDDEGQEVTETTTVTVTQKTKLIEGVTCIVVNDVVEEDGVVIEDTDDWLAQDLDGNVWYCGEIAQDFETFEGDVPEELELVDIGGSWKAGRDGAEAGILVPASPEVGAVHRNEVALGEAEDVIEILSVEGTEAALAAACTGDCLVTRDFSPLEPDAEEEKYYAPGVGVIVERVVETDDRAELIEFGQL
jgi:hypothetical protein